MAEPPCTEGSWSDVSSLGQRSEKKYMEETCTNHQEHLRLAGIVKGVHADLRNKFKSSGEDELERIWYEHCQNKTVLSKYADAMHHLAVDHWSKNQETRIDWCREVINEYFKYDGLAKVLEKERRRKEKEKERNKLAVSDVSKAKQNAEKTGVTLLNYSMEKKSKASASDSDTVHQCISCSISADSTECDIVCDSRPQHQYNTVSIPVQGRIRLLDVGSCFNPFLDFPELQAIGIDISPATESVFHCDFLHLRTTEPLQVANDTMTTFINNLKDPVEWLPQESFHVVVFSLLLEYFPAPYQRWISCQKAHELLMYNGILIIVTPDSSHQNRNASMMKSWKIAIESLGFKRWRYIKQEHLHCMVFRKIEVTEKDKHESFLKGITPDMIYIPQDLNDVPDQYSDSVNAANSYSYEDEQFYREFVLQEMPGLSSDSDDNDDKES